MENLTIELLTLLRKDCRISLEDLAVMTNSSVKEVATIIDDLEKNKVILRYMPVVNWDKTEKSCVEAMIEVRVTPRKEQGFDTLAERINEYNEVKSLYLMSGGYDLLLLVEANDLKSLAQFVSEKLSTFDGVVSTSTSFILKRYKSEGVVFESTKDDDRLVVSP